MNIGKHSTIPVLIAVVSGMNWYRTHRLAIAAQDLRAEDVLSSTAEAQRTHHIINIHLKRL